MGNVRNTPVELLESKFPIRIVEYAIQPGTGGTGRYRGSNAFVRTYEVLCDQVDVFLRTGRRTYLPWGLEGGLPGAPSSATHIKIDGERVALPTMLRLEMRRGERLVWQAAAGGGFGDPSTRSQELVQQDQLEGLW